MNRRLILLFGMPRSGTTWIAKIFDSHPNTLYRHEPDSGGALRPMPLATRLSTANQFAPIISKFIAELPGLNTPRAAGSLPMFPKSYQSSARLLMKRFTALAAKASESFVGELPVLDLIDHSKMRQIVVVWKSIESLGRLGAILRVEPGSRAVIILRHPCGYIASVLNGERNKQFSSSIASSADYPVFHQLLQCSSNGKRNPKLHDLNKLSPVERLAWRWVLFNEIALEQTETCERSMFVRYEDICARPVREARNLLEFAGLEWHGQVERFIGRSTSYVSENYYSVFKNPDESAFKWEQHLSRHQVDAIMGIVRQSCLHKLYPSTDGLRNSLYA
ncbi:MAG TPA: sulfotransferase [Candidatus Binatia bacterium]|nr:sulfotransferase [Candidatus Binatia bacterium]